MKSQVNSRIYTMRFDDKERGESRMTFRFLVRKTGEITMMPFSETAVTEGREGYRDPKSRVQF